MYFLNFSFTKTPAEAAPVSPLHGAWVKKYLDEGIFIMAGGKTSGLGGLIAVKSIAKSQLRTILAEDPYLAEDIGEYQISEINITLTLPEYESLKSV
jgi:uncharacterized protein YciI